MTSSIPSVIEQQTRWAESQGLTARDSYLTSVSDNLRQNLSDGTLQDFQRGSGGELRERAPRPAKMRALRSSAALSANVFDYWRSPRDATPLQRALSLTDGITNISFEEQFPTGLRGNPPNVDVLLRLDGDQSVAIESKFTEWLSARPRILDPKYFPDGEGLWNSQGLPNCQALAIRLKEPGLFQFLDVPQLLKHALGLATKKDRVYTLLYIYFDWPGPEGKRHSREIALFRDLVGEEIRFRATTYQQLFQQLGSTIRPEDGAYLEYLMARYSTDSTKNQREAFELQYHEEKHLFDVVQPRFQQHGSLGAYDLFLIVRWKANRAISKVASALVRISGSDLEHAARELTQDLYTATGDRERFLVLSKKWKLRLPMASAILTVLFPDNFTVYDVRACEMLGDFHSLATRTDVESRWKGYLEFKNAVERETPAHLDLRDKDRYLWARSRHEGLQQFVKRDFSAAASPPS